MTLESCGDGIMNAEGGVVMIRPWLTDEPLANHLALSSMNSYRHPIHPTPQPTRPPPPQSRPAPPSASPFHTHNDLWGPPVHHPHPMGTGGYTSMYLTPNVYITWHSSHSHVLFPYASRQTFSRSKCREIHCWPLSIPISPSVTYL